MKKSTIKVILKHGWRVDRALHNYIYFVFYQPYIKVAVFFIDLLEKLTWFTPLVPAIQALYNRFHAKFISFEDVKKILSLNEDLVADTEKNRRIIPFKYAHKIIFKDPEHIAVMDCPCKKTIPPYISANCCIAVGRDLSTFWTDHCKKYNARKITQSEALEMVKNYRKSGHVTQAFFKVATGGVTGVICNCRPESCISLKASKITKNFATGLVQSVSSGYSVKHQPQSCLQCGACLENCHSGALTLNQSGLSYDTESCFGCGLCVDACAERALALFKDPAKPLPLDVDLVREEFVSDSLNKEVI